MKKTLFITASLFLFVKIAFGQATVDLNGVTFGFGAGPTYSFVKTYDYSLTTDETNSLKLQPLNKGGFAIATILMVKLGQLSFDPNSATVVSQSKKAEYLASHANNSSSSKKWVNFRQRLSVNLAINLADVSSNVTFNKNVSGGIGLGYFLTDNLQLALFYDISQVPQMRDYVVNTYQDKPIPNGSGTNYNSLSTSDNNLFYNKTVSGLSLKLIFSIGNQKSNTATTGQATQQAQQ